MEHIAAILLLLGCDDSGSACTELPAPQVGYETVQTCEMDIAPVLSHASSDYPLILATCIAIDPLAEGNIEIVWDINSEGDLIAEAIPFDDEAISIVTKVANAQIAGKANQIR